MPMHLRLPQSQAGLSLLEVLVATLVLSAGLLGLASLQIAGMKTTHNSHQMQQATWLVQDLLERMRANKTDLFHIDPVTNKPDSAYLVNAKASNYCPTANTASGTTVVIDMYQVMCGQSSGSGSGIQNVLMNGQLTVTCPTNNCRNGVQIALQWNERKASQQGNDFDSANPTDGIETFQISLQSVL